MATIEAMPNEILSSVLSHLGRADLVATSQVSRHFCTLSRIPLYKEPNLPLEFDEDGWRPECSDSAQECLGLFLRTLLLSPARETLAHYVQALSMDLECDIESNTRTPGTDELTAAASNLGYKDHPLTIQGAQLTLMLRLLPRLTSLDLRSNPRPRVRYTHFQDSLMSPATLPVALRNIRVFKCIGDPYLTYITPPMLLALLKLPSIREISASVRSNLYQDEQFKSALAIAVGTSRVTKLFLARRSVTPEFIIDVLQVPKSLTHFSCAPYNTFYDREDHVHDLRQALALHKFSLAELDLDPWDTTDLDAWKCKTIGTFPEWPVLRTLRLSLVMLLGDPDNTSSNPGLADMLPRCLRALFV